MAELGHSRVPSQNPQFVRAAFVPGDEIAQVPQHDIACPEQRGQCLLPGRVAAVAFIDPVASLDVGSLGRPRIRLRPRLPTLANQLSRSTT